MTNKNTSLNNFSVYRKPMFITKSFVETAVPSFAALILIAIILFLIDFLTKPQGEGKNK